MAGLGSNMSSSTARRRCFTGQTAFVIEQFEREMKIAKVGDEIESRPFCVQENKEKKSNITNMFTIVVNPNGDKSEAEKHVSIYLRNWNDEVRTVDFQIRVGNRTYLASQTIKPKSSCGNRKFMKHDEVKDYLMEGSLEMTCCVTMVG